jgi:Ca2+-binding RTX toxin-like protein
LYADGGNARLKGGSGNNVLIGTGGGDLLVGGAGRNLLIGEGADRLVSNGGQDLLIAGSTFYDFDEVALAAILAEWSSADSLAARVANLTGNTASPYFSAARLNGNSFLLDGGPNQTVFNDYSSDAVTAGSGPDWILAGTADKITGLTASDVAFLFGP